MNANKTKNSQIQKLWDTTKVVFRGKFTIVSACVKREETAQISNLKKLEKEEKEARKEKNKPITNRRKKIIKTRM